MAFFQLGNKEIGETISKVEYSKNYFSEKEFRGAVLYLAEADGFMSQKMATLFVRDIKLWAKNPSMLPGASWASYHPRYANWKNENYPHRGPWFRTGLLLGALGHVRKPGIGQTVGFSDKFTVSRHGYGNKGPEVSGAYTAGEMASRLEYGHSGMFDTPARPLFGPALKLFLRTHYSQALDVAEKAISQAHSKYYQPEKTKSTTPNVGRAIKGFVKKEIDKKINSLNKGE